LADLQRTVYPHSGHPSSEGRAQDSVSAITFLQFTSKKTALKGMYVYV